jgi:hypothetical protein
MNRPARPKNISVASVTNHDVLLPPPQATCSSDDVANNSHGYKNNVPLLSTACHVAQSASLRNSRLQTGPAEHEPPAVRVEGAALGAAVGGRLTREQGFWPVMGSLFVGSYAANYWVTCDKWRVACDL